MKTQTFPSILLITAILAMSSAGLFGQTRIDAGSQTRNLDFGQAESTIPAKTGLALPATCRIGEQFFRTDAAAGKNLFGCVAPNQWSLLTGADPVPSPAGQANKLLSSDGSQLLWQVLAGDVSGNLTNLVVDRLQGRPLPGATPTDGDSLIWDNGHAAWVYGSVTNPNIVAGGGIEVSGNIISVDDSSVVRYYTFNGAPGGLCQAGRDFFTDLSSSKLYFCIATDTWQVVDGPHTHPTADITGLAPSATIDTTNAANVSSGIFPTGRMPAFTGDVVTQAGQATTTVAKLQGRTLPAAPPANGDTLVWDASNNYWVFAPNVEGPHTHPTADITGLAPSATIDTTNAANVSSGIFPTGRMPAFTGDVVTQAGQATTTVAKLQGRTLPAAPPANGDTLVWDASNNYWVFAPNVEGPHTHPAAEITGLAPSATSDTTNAANITSGTLAAARLPGTIARTNQGNTWISGSQSFAAAGSTIPAKTGTLAGRPSTCSQGEIYFSTDVTAGQNLYFCTAPNIWTQMSAGGVRHYILTLAATTGLSASATQAFSVPGIGPHSTETQRRMSVPVSGTITAVYGITNSAQASGGSPSASVACSLKNNGSVVGSPSAVGFTIPGNTPAGTSFSETTNTAAVTSGDGISWSCQNNHTGTSALFTTNLVISY